MEISLVFKVFYLFDFPSVVFPFHIYIGMYILIQRSSNKMRVIFGYNCNVEFYFYFYFLLILMWFSIRFWLLG